jgi:sugar lactone lactonase YvrE
VQLDTKTAGSVSGEVQIVDSSGVVPGSNAYLYGVGQGSNIAAVSTTAAQSVATGLQEPGQVAGDAFGDVFVADATLGTVEDYPVSTTARPFVGTAITGFTAPTGVAVDPVGDLYVGDSGSVYEIPYVSGALATKEQTALLKGLGNDLNLAADASGDVFVADKSNKQVIEIPNPQTALLRDGLSNLVLGASAKFTSPSAIATDNSGNVWVADGANLWEITLPYGQAAEVITGGLSAPVTGLAIDPSGSIFVAESTGLWWIPYLASSGGLSFSQAVQVSSIPVLGSAPIGVGLDGFENAYVSYGSGASAGLSQVGAGGSVNFDNYSPELNPDVPFEYDALLFNLGNAPLTLSAFSGDSITGTNAGDFTVGAATENSPGLRPWNEHSAGKFLLPRVGC